MRWFNCLLILLLSLPFASAATIHGVIYDISLDRVSDIVVEINTEPRQHYISKNGTYSFDVPPGNYTIEARHYVAKLLESGVEENISIRGDGVFVLDLVLFPAVDSELLDEAEAISLADSYFSEKRDYLLIAIAVVLLAAILLVIYLVMRSRAPKKDVKEANESDDYLDKVLELVKLEKRVTQKGIRKQIPLSEAKISLIISELESKGLVRKIKKGRGNIIMIGGDKQ